MSKIPYLFVSIACALSVTAHAADEVKTQETGLNKNVVFTARSQHSEQKEFLKHFSDAGYNFNEKEDYKLENESFVRYVPKNYDPTVPYGLIVWIDPGNGGGDPPVALLDKYRLMWIGGKNAGNERTVSHRLGLALDGLENMKALYNIDNERVYVSGFSGGGRCSSMMTMAHPELFKGGYYICGCNRPPEKTDKSAKTDNRFVLLTGTKDMNLQDTKNVRAAYDQAGFKNVTYLEVPEMGHTVPPGEWFEKAVVALDAPFAEKAKSIYTTASADDKKGRLGDAMKGYAKAEMYGGEQDFVKQAEARRKELAEKYQSQLLELEKNFKEEKYYQSATEAESLVKDYGAGFAIRAQEILLQLQTPEMKVKIKEQELSVRKEMANSQGKDAIAQAEKIMQEDLGKGYLALKSVAAKYSGTDAGTEASEKLKQMLADPEKKKKLKSIHDDIQAEKLMSEAREYARKKSYVMSRVKLNEIIDQYPDSAVAGKAKEALEKIQDK